jgi:hypothetical protein
MALPHCVYSHIRCQAAGKKRHSFLQRFWEIAEATIEDLAFGVRSSRPFPETLSFPLSYEIM